MNEFKKINQMYKLGFLLDGDFDGEQVLFNRKRHLVNSAISIFLYLVVLAHLLVYFTDDEMLRQQLIYFKVSDGSGYATAYLNLGNASSSFDSLKTCRLTN